MDYGSVAYNNANFELVVGPSRLKVGFEFDISGQKIESNFLSTPTNR
jgi:hypothetical protein